MNDIEILSTFAEIPIAATTTDIFPDLITVENTAEDSLEDGSTNLTGDDIIEGSEGDDDIASGAGDDFVEGFGGDDTISGESGEDTLIGGSGSDQLDGGFGDDLLQGDGGDDRIEGSDGSDVGLGGDGDDEMHGNEGNDSLFGEGGNDSLFGDAGEDLLDGDSGNDLIGGGAGNDTLLGGPGFDALDGGLGDDVLLGGDGDDELKGDEGNDTIQGGSGSDYLEGGAGADSLVGGQGDDQIQGGAGSDTIQGGAGEDIIDGGSGFDVLLLQGPKPDYTLRIFDQDTVLNSNIEGIDVLRNVELLQFSDGSTQAIGSHPWISTASPVIGSESVSAATPITIQFSEAVFPGDGSLTLKTTNGRVIDVISTSNNPSVEIKGDTLAYAPSNGLKIYTDYVVELSANAVQDANGEGNYASTVTRFSTNSIDGFYHFFVVAFSASPGAIYLGQLADAYNYFKELADSNPLKMIVDIFTTKSQFTSVYPESLSPRDFAATLVENVVKNSATPEAKAKAMQDVEAALGIGWTRGDVIYTVFGNLASKPLNDPEWGNTALQFKKQLAVAKYLTEEMSYASEDVAVLRQSISEVTNLSDVSTIENIVELIGTLPPGV